MADDLDYLEIVKEKTLSEWEKTNVDEVDRNLTALGVGLEPDQLYAKLTDIEKKEFNKLAEQMQQNLCGVNRSAFKPKRRKANNTNC